MVGYHGQVRAVARSDHSLTFFDLIAGNLTLQQILLVSNHPEHILEKICLATNDLIIVRCGPELLTYKFERSQENTGEFVKSSSMRFDAVCPGNPQGPLWIRSSPMYNYLYMYFDDQSKPNFFVFQVATEEMVVAYPFMCKLRPNDVVWADNDSMLAVLDEKDMTFWEIPSGRIIQQWTREPNQTLFMLSTDISENPIKCIVSQETELGREILRFEFEVARYSFRGMISEKRSVASDISESSYLSCPVLPTYFFEVQQSGLASYDLRLRCVECFRYRWLYTAQNGLWWSPTRCEFVIWGPSGPMTDSVSLVRIEHGHGPSGSCLCESNSRCVSTIAPQIPKGAVISVEWAKDGNMLLLCETLDFRKPGKQTMLLRLSDGNLAPIATLTNMARMSLAGDYVCELGVNSDNAPRALNLYTRDGQQVFSMIHDLYNEILWF